MTEKIVRLFRRETSSKEFIPVIDGLRFLAIAMVVLYHADAFIRNKSASIPFAVSDAFLFKSQSYNIFAFGSQGVQLFFVISGFILAIPFLRYSFGLSDKKPSLKPYFLRRLTRLEPPYSISTILIFLMVIYVGRDGLSNSTLFASLGASLLYLHNLIFPGTQPLINSVTWSLEVEVQYYVLAPFIIAGLGRLKDRRIRRGVMAALIVVLTFAAWMLDVRIRIGFTSILTFFQYFMSGILLCDIFLLDRDWLSRLDGKLFFAVGLIFLVLITCTEHALSASLAMRFISPVIIFTFFALVLGNSWWRRIFSSNILTLIGGMCYSIYLLHYVIISAVGRLSINRLKVGDSFAVYYLVQIAVLMTGVLAVSAAFFLLLEKPCMKRDWHLRLSERLKSFWFLRKKASAE